MTENLSSSNTQAITLAGRIVGVVKNHELVKRVQMSKHLLKSPRGWAVDAYALSVARTLGAVGVRIEDTETGSVYRADMATIDAHGWQFDYGHGRQIALPLSYWQIEGAQSSELDLPVQAALFA